MNLMGMGPMELAVIIIIGVVILGPDKLVKTARNFGRYARGFQKNWQDVMDEFSRETDDVKDDLKININTKKLKQDLKVDLDDEQEKRSEELSIDGQVPFRPGDGTDTIREPTETQQNLSGEDSR